jgi:hypothetical protein
MLYHVERFFQCGALTYKIRKEKVDFLRDVQLSIPGRLLVIPHDEFMISIPRGAIKTSQGDLLNIYVCQEEFDEAFYSRVVYEVEGNIKKLVQDHPGKIKRIIRCYSVSYSGTDESSGRVNFYQLPVIEDEDVWEQFQALVDTSIGNTNRDTIKEVFNLVLNFCAYLSCPDPEVEKRLGIVRKPKIIGSKKWRAAEKENMVNAYDYFDVGRITAARYCSDSISYQEAGRTVRRFKVRRHIRAQWFGSKEGGKPGTEQKLIMIEDHWKGDDVADAFKPKNIEVS